MAGRFVFLEGFIRFLRTIHDIRVGFFRIKHAKQQKFCPLLFERRPEQTALHAGIHRKAEAMDE